jgi:hypothetical protein
VEKGAKRNLSVNDEFQLFVPLSALGKNYFHLKIKIYLFNQNRCETTENFS